MYEYANEANIMGNKHATGLFLVVGVHLKTFSSIGSLKLIEDKTILLDKRYPFPPKICDNI